MNPTIKIYIDNLRQVIWPLIFLGLIRYYEWFSTREMAVIYVFILLVVIGFMQKLIIPKISGMRFYCLFIIYSFLLGVALYPLRNVLRDLYYVLPSVIIIILGYYLYRIYNKNASIMKTIVMLGTIISTLNFFNMLRNPSNMNEFASIRKTFSPGSYEVMIAFLTLFLVMFIYKEKIFSKWFQRYSFCIMLLNLLLTLARSIWIEVIAGCIVILFANAIFNKEIQQMIKIFTKVAIVFVIGLVIFFHVAPKDVADEFSNKFAKSTEELDSEQEFDSVDEVMGNWRAYEIQSAENQWKKSNVAVELFGAGMGKGVEINYVPHTWKGVVENGEIPLLHNAYYTILPKGGLVGVAALTWFMLANVVMGLRIYKKKFNIRQDIILLMSISVVFLIQSYIVRGPVAQTVNLSWALLVGWINARINYTEDSFDC